MKQGAGTATLSARRGALLRPRPAG